MEILLDINEIKDDLHYPIAICDGGKLGSREQYLIYLFNNSQIEFTVEEDLYECPDIDILKRYQTIAFSTQDSAPGTSSELKKLFSFDMSNLKTVIVLNENAFKKVKEISKNLNIKCLGFEPESFQFFDPFTKKIPLW